jgi:hypothetical protein
MWSQLEGAGVTTDELAPSPIKKGGPCARGNSLGSAEKRLSNHYHINYFTVASRCLTMNETPC